MDPDALKHGKKPRIYHPASGTNVMITIVGDFCQLLAKKVGVFLKNQAMIVIAVILVNFFRRKHF
jgi:hypothetical protein